MAKEKPPPIPGEQPDSVRRQIIGLLREGDCSARDLSAAVHLPEKEVYSHLDHIRKSAGPQHLRLQTHPARCRHCGFAFVKREKLKKPGRCPVCSSEQINSPRFEIKETRDQS